MPEEGLTEQEKTELLEEILSKSEAAYDFERTVQANTNFPVLTKYLYTYTLGLNSKFGTEHRTEALSETNLKKGKGSSEILDLCGAGSSHTEVQPVKTSDTWAEADKKLKDLQKTRGQLAKSAEEILQCITDISWRADDVSEKVKELELGKKQAELDVSKENLDKFLQVVRAQVSIGIPQDR